MQLTVKAIKDKLENMKDDDLVYIERIEDVYFNEFGWKSETVGTEPNDTTFLNASCAMKSKNKLIILAHI